MDLTTIVISIAEDIVAFQSLASAVAVMVGIYFCAKATVDAMKKSASPGSDISGQGLAAAFFIGAVVVHFSGAMSSAAESMGQGTVKYGLVSYSAASTAGVFAPAVNAVLTIVSTFGWWYGLKGFTMLKRASSGSSGGGYEDYAWKGMIHVLGGAALINITETLDAFRATIGMTF